MNAADIRVLHKVFEHFSEAIKERFDQQDKEIAELRAEIQRLKQEPRMSLAQKLRARGQS